MPEIFPWSDSYSVGVMMIDIQHKKLIALLNELATAMKTGRGRDVIEHTLAGVVDYTVEHFAYEEKEMQRFDYPDYESHKKLHDAFVSDAKDLQKRIVTDRFQVSIEVLQKLKNWVVQHIDKADKQYAPYMTKRKAA